MKKLKLLTLTMAHFCVDSYATMLAPILPLVIERQGLNLASAGILGTIVSACNLSQPLLGMWADHMRRRWLVVGGVGLAAVFTPLLGMAPGYWVLVTVLCLGGFGVAAFHPQAFSLAGELSGSRRSFGLALFVFGGTMGLGVTPLWVPFFAQNIGLEWLPVVGIPGVLFLLLVLRFVPLDNPHAATAERPARATGLNGAGRPLALITAVVILRSVTALGFAFFLTVLLSRERGLSLVEGGVPLAAYNIAGVSGALLFGYLGDRVNAKPLVCGSLFLSVPALLAFLQIEGALGYVPLAIGGGLLLASNSILVALAQELVPQRSGLASSLPLGFSWGIASLSLGPVGWLADTYGVTETLRWLAMLPLVTGTVALFLPARPDKIPARAG
jgi:FSR family fosmidomycin resistance protein-like MFS transporter